jgi:hypothetical protein
MLHDFAENVIGTTRVIYEEQIFTKLIIDSEEMTSIAEVNPGLRYVIAEKPHQFRDMQRWYMISNLVPEDGLGQGGEEPRTVVHSKVTQATHTPFPFAAAGDDVPRSYPQQHKSLSMDSEAAQR